RCSELSSAGLGIALDGIAVIDLHPPGEVVESYYEVARAMERRDQAINDALKDATARIKKNQADVEKKLADARAAAEESVQDAEQSRLRFNALYVPSKQQPDLVKFRLYWDAVSKGLSGRELILIDSDKVNLRRNMMLFDPELLRTFVPIFQRESMPK